MNLQLKLVRPYKEESGLIDLILQFQEGADELHEHWVIRCHDVQSVHSDLWNVIKSLASNRWMNSVYSGVNRCLTAGSCQRAKVQSWMMFSEISSDDSNIEKHCSTEKFFKEYAEHLVNTGLNTGKFKRILFHYNHWMAMYRIPSLQLKLHLHTIDNWTWSLISWMDITMITHINYHNQGEQMWNDAVVIFKYFC